ncbi:MAG: phosphoglycolate phosphatase [Yoonia sp.]|jgi:phosphoglycolate phosphatase
MHGAGTVRAEFKHDIDTVRSALLGVNNDTAQKDCKMIKGIIFDKDGTLFDFNATWGPSTRGMIASETGGDPVRMAEMADVLGYDLKAGVFVPGSLVIAETVSTVADAMLGLLPDVTKPELMARMKAATKHVPQVEPTPLRPVLDALHSMGLTLGVATNDAEEPALANLAHVIDKFAFIAGFDSGFGGKPAPGQLLGFCAQTDLDPTNCIMVGDSLHDLHAGRAAGMMCVGVLTGPAERAELTPHADVVLGTIAELPTWIMAQNARW